MAAETHWNGSQQCAIYLLEKWGFELAGDEKAARKKTAHVETANEEHRPVLRRTRQDGRIEQVTVDSRGSCYWRLTELGTE